MHIKFFFSVLMTFAVCSASVAAKGNEAAPLQDEQFPVQEVQGGVQEAFKELMSVMGAMTTGMAEGMKQGAQSMQADLDSMDGSKVIATAEVLKEYAEVRVLKAEQKEGDLWHITLAVKNIHDFPLRLSNLDREQQVLLLDRDGFAYSPTGDLSRTLSVPAKAAVKHVFVFSGLEQAVPKIFRLYGVDFRVEDYLENRPSN